MTEIIELKQEELKSLQASFLKMIGNDSRNIKQVVFEPNFNRISIHHELEDSDFDLYLFLGLVDEYFEDYAYQVHYSDNHLILVEANYDPDNIPAIAFAPTCLEEALNHDFFEMVINGLELPVEEVRELVAAKYQKEIENLEARKEREKYCKWKLTNDYYTKHLALDDIVVQNSVQSEVVILTKEFLKDRSDSEIERLMHLLRTNDQDKKLSIALEYEAQCIKTPQEGDTLKQWLLMEVTGKIIGNIKSFHKSLEDLFMDVKRITYPSCSVYKIKELPNSMKSDFSISIDGRNAFIVSEQKLGEPYSKYTGMYLSDFCNRIEDITIE